MPIDAFGKRMLAKARPQHHEVGLFCCPPQTENSFQHKQNTAMGKHLPKAERRRLLEEKQQAELQIKMAYQKSARINKSFVVLIEDAQNEALRNEYANNGLYQQIVSFIVQNEQVTKKDLLSQWLKTLTFLAKNLEKKCPKWFKNIEFIKALTEVAKYRSSWIRPLEEWQPKSKGEYEKFRDLVAYLFAEYKYPAFLNHIFFYQQDYFFIRDFIFLAQGGSIKYINSSIPLTQRMRVEFLKSSEGFRVFEAFRYAQVIGLGGDQLLAYRIAYSWLGRNEKRDEVLWEAFIRILINGGMFNHDKIGELIDYVRYELNQNPNYTLKGRTLQSLIRQSDSWHNTFSKNLRKQGLIIWKSGNFENYETTEGTNEKMVTYKIVELLSNKELTEEGIKMHHCVGSYSYYCEQGRTRIVSLRKYNLGIDETERLATIEVDMRSKRIVQAKYRYNQAINSKALSIIHNWASLNGFSMGKYL
ncbi:MAG: PcfJ domain-containing protein [Spirosomataceae bacterium]